MTMIATIFTALSVFRVIETPDMDPAVFVDAPAKQVEMGEYLLITWRGRGNRVVVDVLTKDFSIDQHEVSGGGEIRFPLKKGTFLSYRVHLYSGDTLLDTFTDPMWVTPITKS